MEYDNDEVSLQVRRAIKQSKQLALERAVRNNPEQRAIYEANERKKRIQMRLNSRNENLVKMEASKYKGEKLSLDHIDIEYQKNTKVIIYMLNQRDNSFKPTLRLIKGSEGEIVKINKNEKLQADSILVVKKAKSKKKVVNEEETSTIVRAHLALIK